MKHLIRKVSEAILILISGVILGLILPLFFSLIISILTSFKLIEVTSSVPFWVFSVIGIGLAYVYINSLIGSKDSF
jgi:hypothetical protein